MQVPPSAPFPSILQRNNQRKDPVAIPPRSGLIKKISSMSSTVREKPGRRISRVWVFVCEDRKMRCANQKGQNPCPRPILECVLCPQDFVKAEHRRKAIIIIAKPNQVTSRNASLLFWAPFPRPRCWCSQNRSRGTVSMQVGSSIIRYIQNHSGVSDVAMLQNVLKSM